MSTLVSVPVQNQLRDILLNAGFPEEALGSQAFNFHGPDANLDIVSQSLRHVTGGEV